MRTDVLPYIRWIWIAVGIVWLIGGMASKRAARHEAAGSRFLHVAIMVAAFSLFYSARLNTGPLAQRFVPDTAAIAWVGLALAVAGCVFAIWARIMLAGDWSASVTVKRDHRLVRKGPYGIVRHPIYSGFLLALGGTALALGEWRAIAGLLLAFIGWHLKSRVEERFMAEQFGAEYAVYQREVKALIPFVL